MPKRAKRAKRGRDDARLVAVRLQTADGRSVEVEIRRNQNIDAVFTSKSAVDKFLIPFYEQLTAAERARLGMDLEKFRAGVARQLSKYGIVFVPHMAPCRCPLPDLDLQPRYPVRL